MSTIEQLIRACVDDERVLSRGGRIVGGELGKVLRRLALEREDFVDELQHVGTTLAGSPRATGSWMGRARDLALSAMTLAAGARSAVALAACRRSQHRTEVLFADALDDTWKNDVRSVLVEQH